MTEKFMTNAYTKIQKDLREKTYLPISKIRCVTEETRNGRTTTTTSTLNVKDGYILNDKTKDSIMIRDNSGNVIEIRNPEGIVYKTYRKDGQPSSTYTTNTGAYKSFKYDRETGALISTAVRTGTRAVFTNYENDEFGRQISAVSKYQETALKYDDDAMTVTMSIKELGDVQNSYNKKQNHTTISKYDTLGRLIKKTTGKFSIEYTYDGDSFLLTEEKHFYDKKRTKTKTYVVIE